MNRCTDPKEVVSYHWRRRSAFTLVEILVVMAIISVLIAILFPAMSAARRSSRKTTCQSNLRQIATAWHVYLDTYDERFYQRVNANLTYGGISGRGSSAFKVSRPLNPHLGLPEITETGAEVFRCPSDKGSKTATPSCFEYYGTSYMTNLMLIGQDQLAINPADPCRDVLRGINKRLKKLSRSKVSTNAAKLVLQGDFGWISQWNRYDFNKVEWHDRKQYHNLAFLDGHVDFISVRKGLHVTEDYAVIPFSDLLDDASVCQSEVP